MRVPLSSSKSNRWAGQGGRRPRGLNTRGRSCFQGHPALSLSVPQFPALHQTLTNQRFRVTAPSPARWPGPSTPQQDAQSRTVLPPASGPNNLERRSWQTRTLALQAHNRPITEPGAPPCTIAGGGEPRKQACSMPEAPADQAQLAVGFKELSEHPTQAVQVESSMDPCPVIGNVHLSMSLPGVRMGPGDPGIQW